MDNSILELYKQGMAQRCSIWMMSLMRVKYGNRRKVKGERTRSPFPLRTPLLETTIMEIGVLCAV